MTFWKSATLGAAMAFAVSASHAGAITSYVVAIEDADAFSVLGLGTDFGPAQGPVDARFEFFADLSVSQAGVVPTAADLVLDFGGRIATYDVSNVLIEIQADFFGNPGVTAVIVEGATNELPNGDSDFFSFLVAVDEVTFGFAGLAAFGYVPRDIPADYRAGTGNIVLAVEMPSPAALPIVAVGIGAMAVARRFRTDGDR